VISDGYLLRNFEPAAVDSFERTPIRHTKAVTLRRFSSRHLDVSRPNRCFNTGERQSLKVVDEERVVVDWGAKHRG
jgi:hypothetical protein